MENDEVCLHHTCFELVLHASLLPNHLVSWCLPRRWTLAASAWSLYGLELCASLNSLSSPLFQNCNLFRLCKDSTFFSAPGIDLFMSSSSTCIHIDIVHQHSHDGFVSVALFALNCEKFMHSHQAALTRSLLHPFPFSSSNPNMQKP